MCTKGHVWQELQTLQERLGQPGQYLISTKVSCTLRHCRKSAGHTARIKCHTGHV